MFPTDKYLFVSSRKGFGRFSFEIIISQNTPWLGNLLLLSRICCAVYYVDDYEAKQETVLTR